MQWLACAALLGYFVWYVLSFPVSRLPDSFGRCLYTAFGCFLRLLAFVNGVRYKLILPEVLPPDGKMGWPFYNEMVRRLPQSILCWHPHSALTVAPFGFLQPSEVFGRNVFVGVAPALYYVPLLREILMVGNCRLVERRVMDEILDNGKSLLIQPGGVYEQLRFTESHETAYFNARLGFLRLAVRRGLAVVPIYCFGENQLYQASPSMQPCCRLLGWLGLPVAAATGKFGLPWCWPLSRDMVVVVGEPIPVERAEVAEEDAMVVQLFGTYLAAVRALWRDHCHHLPASVARKGLRFVYRGAKGVHTASDREEDDRLLTLAAASAFAGN